MRLVILILVLGATLVLCAPAEPDREDSTSGEPQDPLAANLRKKGRIRAALGGAGDFVSDVAGDLVEGAVNGLGKINWSKLGDFFDP